MVIYTQSTENRYLIITQKQTKVYYKKPLIYTLAIRYFFLSDIGLFTTQPINIDNLDRGGITSNTFIQ